MTCTKHTTNHNTTHHRTPLHITRTPPSVNILFVVNRAVDAIFIVDIMLQVLHIRIVCSVYQLYIVCSM